MKTWFQFVLVSLLVFLLSGCKSAKVTSSHEFTPGAVSKPARIYVQDFELGAEELQHEDGLLSDRPGPLGRIGKRLSGDAKDPAARASELVNLMADSLVKDLAKSDFDAVRLVAGEPMPTNGWLVRGVFTTVQEGNRLRRAMIGFGSGATDLQVVTGVDDLSQGPPKPLYEVDTSADSGKTPGAAPMLILTPIGAPVRFVMAGKDLDKNVKQTATQIAAYVAQRVDPSKSKSHD